MSDTPQGPGWWRASNGLYYPPEARPGSRNEGPGGQDGDQPPTSRDESPTSGDERRDEPVEAPVVDDPAAATSWQQARPDDEPEPRARRRWLRVLLVVLLLAAVAAAVGAVVWMMLDEDTDTDNSTEDTAVTTTEATTTTTEDTGEIPAVELGIGDCFDTAEVGSDDGLVVTTVLLVDCDEPHRAEVFDIGSLDAPSGEAFPGVEARDLAARELCEPGFEEFVGTSLAESDLVLIWLAPTEASWSDNDDRDVACAVGAPDDETLDEPVESSEEPAQASQ